MNILEDVVCPECGGFMAQSLDPQMMKCGSCGHTLSVDEVKGAEEDPVDILE